MGVTVEVSASEGEAEGVRKPGISRNTGRALGEEGIPRTRQAGRRAEVDLDAA